MIKFIDFSLKKDVVEFAGKRYLLNRKKFGESEKNRDEIEVVLKSLLKGDRPIWLIDLS
jgi:hypothetical protein